jgi:hypothetical protein
MKKIPPKKGEVVKKVAKTLAKVVGKGLVVGGGVAALGLGMAGCESTPPGNSNLIVLSGEIVESKSGINPYDNAIVTFYSVDIDGNKETIEKYIYAYPKFQATNFDLQVGAWVEFIESDASRESNRIGERNIITINQRQI